MVDVQTQAAQNQLIIYFGGFFDQSIMGAPVYFWFIFALGMGLICTWLMVVYYRYWIMDKIWDLVICIKKREPIGLVRDRNRVARFKALKYIAQTFEDQSGPDRFFASSLQTAANISGAPLVDVCDYYDWTQDPIMNQAIVEIVDAWNWGILDPAINPNPTNEGVFHYLPGKAPHPDEEKIYDGKQFQQLLASGKLAEYFDDMEIITYKKGTVPVSAYFPVDISSVERYLPKTRSSALFGGYVQHLADNVGQKPEQDKKQMLYWFVGGATLIIVCAVIAYLILHA